VPEIKAAAAQDERIRKVLDLARASKAWRATRRARGGRRHPPGPLTTTSPSARRPIQKPIPTHHHQYNHGRHEQVGMLKIDLLV